MDVTINQALEQAVTAHNSGNLQEAESGYQAILRIQPKHPDASHNLGLLAVSANQIEAALPLFEIALKVNPMIEQFWVSYIDALVKAKLITDAKQAIKNAKKAGFDTSKLELLILQVKVKVDYEEPSRVQLDTLMEHYQNRRLSAAEDLAISITLEFPKHQFAWKVLGSILGQTGRQAEAIKANKTSVVLCPQDAEAHYNLGVTLQELGRLTEAESSYIQAIALRFDYAEAHSQLGITLHELGRLDEAVTSWKHALALKPDSAGVHSNLGITLQKLGRSNEAVASFRRAIGLKSDLVEAHRNLGNSLQELNRWDEAEVSYAMALALKYDDIETRSNQLMCLYQLEKQSLFFVKLDSLIKDNVTNAAIGSLSCRSLLKYGVEKSNLFCGDPLNYVLHIDLNAYYDFDKSFAKKVVSMLKEDRISNRIQSLLINGYQTSGNLFEIENIFMESIQKAIHLEIDKYRNKFRNSEEGFIKKWPAKYKLYGWLVSMKSGGRLRPHIHSNGWLSGSMYINVPPKSRPENGSLVVSLGDEKDVMDTRVNVEKKINVVTGSLVLFPSSLTHYTIPFEAQEERIVLAFDVKEI
tara:strand:- start:113 stop:1861 length:1749 start_codon:yes stop_codon:yes gene_type:complete